MIFGLFRKRLLGNSRSSRRAEMIREAVTPLMQALESRVHLSTYEYDVPSGHSAVYLKKTATSGEVEVHFDNANGTIGHIFTDPGGTDLIVAATSGFLFVDTVPAAFKPSGGIQVQSG